MTTVVSSECRCIIWHPHTQEERELQRKRFETARKYGDMTTAMIYLSSLSGKCLSRSGDNE